MPLIAYFLNICHIYRKPVSIYKTTNKGEVCSSVGTAPSSTKGEAAKCKAHASPVCAAVHGIGLWKEVGRSWKGTAGGQRTRTEITQKVTNCTVTWFR